MWNILSKRTTRSPARKPSSARRFVPRLVALEDRLAPAVLTVTTRADIVNPADGRLSLREAISMANLQPGLDTIKLTAGVYKVALPGSFDDANANGDFDITSPVTIVGVGSGSTFIDGARQDRVFHVRGSSPGSITVTLQGMTIRNGKTTNDGGGIQFVNSHLKLVDSRVVGNVAFGSGGGISNFILPPPGSGFGATGDLSLLRTGVALNSAGSTGGGGIFLGGGTVTLDASIVRQNAAIGNGGGILAHTANLTNTTVRGNSSGADGGGLRVDKAVSATNSTINRNTATGRGAANTGNGGGIYTGQGDSVVSMTGSTLMGNSAAGQGGAVFGSGHVGLLKSTVHGNTAARGGGVFGVTTVTFFNTRVTDNTAGNGGGVVVDFGTATLSGCTVSGNVATFDQGGGILARTVDLLNTTVSGNTAALVGGGVYAVTGSIRNSTIVENYAPNGGGVVSEGTVIGIVVKNSIIALNLLAGTSGLDVRGNFISVGNNLIGIVDGSSGFGAPGDQLGTFAAPLDPLLAPLASNGGRTQTHALLAGSPAIDRANNTGAPATDQRGVARPRDGDGNGSGVADIGAFER